MRALLVVAVTGCWHDAPPPQAPVEPPSTQTSSDEVAYVPRSRAKLDCVSVVDSFADKFDKGDSFKGLRPVLIDVGKTSCIEDGWSETLLACFNDATDEKDIQACYEGMPQEQRDKFGERFRIALQSSSWTGNGGGSSP
jgi:hypothetical protein